jgi:hypothetical protein
MALAIGPPGIDPRPLGIKLGPDIAIQIRETVLDLDVWLDGMRQSEGYGGPAVNWDEDCLDYSGPGLDWRYEGIICGYLNLWHATSNPVWLTKARQAGEDLLNGQLASGNFRNSCFEWNPNTGGSPHEAAACVGLLRLALVLRSLNDSAWMRYFQAAALNVKNFQIRYLWEPRRKVFLDRPNLPAVSPDRQATLAEALFMMARLSGDSSWAEQYALPILDSILAHQVTNGFLTGAIYAQSVMKEKVARFYPLLVARCIPGLLQGYAWTNDILYTQAVKRAGNFLVHQQYSDGSFPQIIYPDGKKNRWPAWVAGVGDILRALCQARAFGVEFDPLPSLSWMLAGRLDNGALRTGVGFEKSGFFTRKRDPRNQLPSCGWVDKAYRFLSTIVDAESLEIAMTGEFTEEKVSNDEP